MRIGAIDVGTNSVHLLVAEITPDGRVQVVETAREQVELGSGGLVDHHITPEAWERGIRALESFKTACDSLGVEDIHAAATSAVRESRNGAEFCEAVKERTGVHVRIIPGSSEARLIYLGARADLDFSQGRVLLFDLGGGSTEFILCDAEATLLAQSLPLGHIRLTDAYRVADPMSEVGRNQIRAHVQKQLGALTSRLHSEDFRTLVGTSGCVRTLARMGTLMRGEVPPEHGHGLVLHRKELDELIDAFTKIPANQLDRLPGMDMKRRRTLPAGAILVREVMKAFQKDTLLTSERGLRDGLIVDWVMRHRPEVSLLSSVPDPRRRSVLAVMERYAVDAPHAEQVARFSTQIFDATASIHALRIGDRRLLEFAALLHDLGHHISGKDHHKHGQYIIRNTWMPGFTAPEIALVGNLVRYHRKGRPKPSNPEIAALDAKDRHRLRVLAAILALADGFDRGHGGNVQDIDVVVADDHVTVRAWTRDAGDLERWAAINRASALAAVLDREVRVEVISRGT